MNDMSEQVTSIREGAMKFHRPLYRWKSVWLGVLVLAFIGWAWVRSMSHLDMLIWNSPSRTQMLELRLNAGEVRAQGTASVQAGIPSGFLRSSFRYKKELHGWFPRAVTSMPYNLGEGWSISVAYWVIALVFLFAWSGFLAWHGWRMRRRVMKAGQIPLEGRE
jgi:hypothetical protein